jgi:autotransporter-associated beta strand protein
VFPVVLLATLPWGAAAQPMPYIFVPANRQLTVVDPVTQSVAGTAVDLTSFDYAAAPSPDGRRVYTVDGGSHLRIWDVATRTLLRTVILSGQALDAVVSPDNSTVWIGDWSNSRIALFDIATNTFLAPLDIGMRPEGLTLTPDGQRIVVVGRNPDRLKIIDITSRTEVGSVALPHIGVQVVVHPNGHTAYVTLYYGHQVAVVDLDNLTVPTVVNFTEAPSALALNPTATELWVTERRGCCLTNGKIQIVSTATNTVIATINGTGFPTGVTFSPDGAQAYATRLIGEQAVSVIDTATRTILNNLPTGQYPGLLAAGPPIIRGDCCGGGITTIASDADLLALGVLAHLPMFDGTLRLTGNWDTHRTISLLSDGAARTDGIIDTNSARATVSGRVIGEGTLVKRGNGRLILNSDATHTGGTRVESGRLEVNATHTGTVTLTAPAAGLMGHGTIGAIQASAGQVFLDGPLTANLVTLGSGVRLDFAFMTTTPVNQAMLNVTGTANVDDAVLAFSGMSDALPAKGTSRTLVTNATGKFRNTPEGWTTSAPSGLLFRLTYGGGNGSDIVLMSEGAPTLAAIGDRTIAQDATLGPIALGVTDDFTAPGVLTITATSSNQALVPDANIQIGNTSGARTLTVTPLFAATGQTTITVTVTDEAGLQAQQTFVLTVKATHSYYLAEGATGGFFSTDILLANPNATPASIDITFSKDDGTAVVRQMTLPATSRTTVRANEIAGLAAAAFSTTVVSTSGVPLVVERTMWWDSSGYGASTEKAGTEGATTWYFAEGSQGYFHTYFLLFNPNITPTVAHVTYLMEGGEAIMRDYPVPASTRVTVDAAELPELMHRSFGARIVFDQPALAERAMYFGETPLYTGGAAAAGVTAPATNWYLAEGATGSFFDTFVLIANPNDAPANLTLTYLPDSGQPIEKTRRLEAHQRLTLNLADQDAALVNASVSTRVSSDQPVVVERSQYWPHGNWYESHANAGQTATGLTWGLAEGRVGGASDARTFILIANPGANAAVITATFLRTDGTSTIKNFTVQPTSRFTIAIDGDANGHAPELTNESFATIVTSTEPVIVERSLYTSTNGVIWTAGTNSTGTRLEP